MKNFYLLIVAALVCIGILPARAQEAENAKIKFTVNISNAEGITCSDYGEPVALHDGANVLEITNGHNITFSAKLPWKIKAVTNKNGTAVDGFYGSDWYLYVNPAIADEVYTIDVINIDEYRTAEFTLNIDDPSLVNAVLSGYSQTLDLKESVNTVKYDPAMETFLYLSPKNYEVPLYSVKKNGVEIASLGESYYSVELEEGCVIDVVAILPDEDRTVTFSYADGAENSISVTVNKQDVSDFDGKTLVVKLGDRLDIKGNNGYKFNAVKVNGSQVNFYGSYNFSVMNDSEVYIDARPYGKISATIIVTNPHLITITHNDEALVLNSGENVIEFPENQSNIMWNVSPLASINSVTVNGTALPSYQTYHTVNDKDVIVFDIEEKIFDQQAVVWVDNAQGKACAMYLEFGSTSDHSIHYTLESGYNLVTYYKGMNPFYANWYASDPEIPGIHLTGKVYLNGERLASPYGDTSTYHMFDLAYGDVLKLFMDSDPVECKVAFDMAEGVEASVVKDIMTTVENPAEGFDCFAGTEVAVSGDNLEVKVNGAAVEGQKNDEGVTNYTFIVNDAETTVSVAKAGSTGVAGVAAEAADAVFNMQGVRVGNSLKGLAPGIYVVAGKKVVVTE